MTNGSGQTEELVRRLNCDCVQNIAISTGKSDMMRLREIRITGLFGTFNHKVSLNLDDRITIIHGPNGYGKTAILRMVAGIFRNQFSALRMLPFESLELEFDDDRVLKIERKTNSKKSNEEGDERQITFSIDGQQPFECALNTRKNIDQIRRYAGRKYSDLTQLGPDMWQIDRTGEVLGPEEIVERFRDHFPSHFRAYDIPEWLKDLQGELNVHLTEANRLEYTKFDELRAEGNMAPVKNYSENLSQRINSKLAEYAELSQSLDRSFPNRLVSSDYTPSLEIDDVKKRLSDLEMRRSKLTEAGILEKEHQNPLTMPPGTGEVEESKLGVLAVYINDTKKKLGIFDDLYSRIDLFQSIINQRFLFKSMTVSRDGFAFTTDDGHPLDSSSLSTGEQHEVVMLFELLFLVEPDSLILIDEPEISLHVAWQKQFLSDLSKISSLSRLDVLIATHSPQIISDRWDLTVELKGPGE